MKQQFLIESSGLTSSQAALLLDAIPSAVVRVVHCEDMMRAVIGLQRIANGIDTVSPAPETEE